MLKPFFLLLSVILLNHLSSFSQAKYLYYFDNDINLVKKSKAVFDGIGVYNNGVLELKITDAKSNHLLLIQHFTDSSLQVSNGLFVTYYPYSDYLPMKKEWEGNYLLGQKDGAWRKWNLNGKILDSAYFEKGDQVFDIQYTYDTDGKLMLQTIRNSSNPEKVTTVYIDERGKVIPSDSIKKMDDPDKIFIRLEVEPTFPGGEANWSRYISKALQMHFDEFTERDFGTVVIKFIVDKDGVVSDVIATNMKGTKFAKVVIDAIKKGPHWNPGMQNGHKVKSYKTQPVTLLNPSKL
jgi:antitoxin component YwqK of YwqJK toxin-antitoxin module